MRSAPLTLLALVACGGGSEVGSPDAGGGAQTDAGLTPDATPGDADFDHFSFSIEPAVPLVGRDFTLVITAHDSADDSSVLDFDGTVSVTSSVGTVSGQVSEAELSGGTAELTLQLDTAGEDVTLTVTEDVYPDMTGTTAPFTVSPPGDTAGLRDVVINEVNWFGNATASGDEWIELRNVSGGALNLSEWTIENAGSSSSPTVQLENGTTLEAGDYLVIGSFQGPDQEGSRTSLTGVAGVQVQPLGLTNGGEALRLKDPAGTIIDSTPEGGWPAGNNQVDLTMERRDDVTGGGYTEGSQAGAWTTWSSLDGTDTTNADTSDRGTPGADNTDPEIFDHFTLEVAPDPPVAGLDFTMTVTAYSSTDDSEVITSYDGSISVTATSGTLSGQVSGQPIASGAATLTLQNDTVADGVTLTVTDDIYPSMTGSVLVDIRPEGDVAGAGDIVINEINWFGNGADSGDEWIELRNISGGALNLSGWTLVGAGTGSSAVTIDPGTVLADGEYLVLAQLQGPDQDGQRTSLTGVSGVQLHTISLTDGGEDLQLWDVEGGIIDVAEAAGGWPAGDDGSLRSMERRDDITGGGYQESGPGTWYTWNPFAHVDTTSPDTADQGTPGAANSDPFPTPLYASGFESGEDLWENTAGTGGFSNTPPPGTAARTGSGVATTDSITQSYTGRQVRSADCIALDSSSLLGLSIFATASTDNGGNELRGRLHVLFFDDASCTTANATTPEDGESTGTILPQGAYVEMTAEVSPPAGATHFKIWFQVKDNGGAPDNGDGWAADDVSALQ